MDYFRNSMSLVTQCMLMDDCDKLKLDRLNFVKSVLDSEDLSLGISHETIQLNKILHAIKKTSSRST